LDFLSTYWSFILASVALTLLPGPDLVFVIIQSVTNGARIGFTIAIGLVSGLIIHTTLAATGLSLVIAQSDWAIKGIQYAGAAYLFYLAYLGIKSDASPIALEAKKENTSSFWKRWRTGFFMNVLNPKVSLFFIAFFPQFLVLESEIPISYQMITLGLLFMVQAILIFGLVCLIAGKLTSTLRSERFWNITKWVNVGVLALLGIGLLVG
jgi:threonine/homoserine/homoserine lactone efflux protein